VRGGDLLCAGTRVRMKFDGCSGLVWCCEKRFLRGRRAYPLSDDIAYRPGSDDPVILVSVKVQIFLHS
jgi:hypothetical protein